MKCMTLNLNGIRASVKKGLVPWLKERDLDFICLQEVRAQKVQIPKEIDSLGYYSYWSFATKPGYSGVAILSKEKPIEVNIHSDFNLMDDEGRFVEAEYNDFILVSLYLPSGTSGDARQEIKYKSLDYFFEYLKNKLQSIKPVMICGDFNIAHQNIDIKNWKGNKKNSGFLPEERAWIGKVIEDLGYVDTFRQLNPEEECYTWWSNRGKARENNVGWRIDYHFVSSDLKNKIKKCWVESTPKLSDHAPQILEFSL